MKLLHVLLLFIATTCWLGCNENKKTTATTKTIAAGQMPALAKDNANDIHVVYGCGDSLMYCFSNDEGASFSKPAFIDTIKNLFAFATRGPQIAATKNGVVVIAANKDGNIYSFLKNDKGEWMRSAKVNDIDSADKEGFLGLSSDGNATFFAIWTDVRFDKRNKIYGAKSTDGGKSWNKNILVYASPDSSVCECCKPSVVMSGNNIYVIFRNWLDGNRDLYLIESADGGNHFEQAKKLGAGSWKLDGCPMDGGSIAVAKDRIPQTVWRRNNTIFSATPGAMENKIGEGKGCSINIVNGKNVYAFSDLDGNVVCVLPDGSREILGKGILPLLTSVNNSEVLCVWQHNKEIYYRLMRV